MSQNLTLQGDYIPIATLINYNIIGINQVQENVAIIPSNENNLVFFIN